MKKVILILLLIAIPLVYAEITENKKVLNLKVENNTIFLSGDNLNYERELTSNFSRDITWQFFTNATCNVEKALADVANKKKKKKKKKKRKKKKKKKKQKK